MAIQASVGGEISISGLDARVIARLRRALAYPNPAYLDQRKVGKAVIDDTEEIEVPKKLTALVECADGSVRLPRGAIDDVRPILDVSGISAWEDTRSCGSRLELNGTSLELRDYQQYGANEIDCALQGLLVLPCGSGKTVAGIGALKTIGRSTLVIVPTRHLTKQWYDECKKFLGIEIAIFGSGSHQWGPITVATKDAIHYHYNKIQNKLRSFGTLIVDECHRVPTRFFQRILRSIPAKWRLGLTATPEREDGQTNLIGWSFGPTLLERTTEEMIEAGWLIRPNVRAIYTTFEYDMPDIDDRHWLDYNRLTEKLIKSTKRNSQIVETIVDHLKKDREGTALILSNRKEHGYRLVKMIKEHGIDQAACINSDVSKKKQSLLIDGLRDGSLKVAIATSLADEGLNIPRLSGVALALPEGSKKGTTQKSGRLMRPFGTNGATIYDFVDPMVTTLFNRWIRRRAVFRRMKLEIEECQTLSLFG